MTDPDRPWCAALASRWAVALHATCYIPLSRPRLEATLRGYLAVLADALHHPDEPAEVARAGEALVGLDAVGPRSLSDTVALLHPALLDLATSLGLADAAQRAATVVGEFTGGYASAWQDRTLHKQDDVMGALVRARQEVERELRASQSQFEEVFTSAAVGMAISQLDGTIRRSNDALTEIIGYRPDELRGRALAEFVHPEDVADLLGEYEMLEHLPVKHFRKQCRLVREDGELAWTYLAVSLLTDGDGAPTHFVTSVEDITDLYLLKERFKYQTLYDTLTELPNRQFFSTHLQGVLERPNLSTRVQLYHLDLDGLAAINNGLDRQVGDQILRVFARKLTATFEHLDAMVARLDGAKFVVLVQYREDQPPDVVALVDRVREELAEPIYVGGHGVVVTASIAVVDRQVGEVGSEELLAAADLTLRQVKRAGRAQWGLYDSRRYELDRARYELASTFPGALENGELELRCEALVPTSGGAVAGALLRTVWDSPHYGLVPYQRCVALAEESGVDRQFGEWLLRTAVVWAGHWRQHLADRAPFLVCELVAAQAADPDLVAVVRKVLGETGLAPTDLRLAFPAAGLHDPEGGAADNAEVLADLGVPIVLAGYGEGHRDVGLLARLRVSDVLLAPSVLDVLCGPPGPTAAPEPAAAPAADPAAEALTALLGVTARYGVNVIAPGLASPGQLARLAGRPIDLVGGPVLALPDRESALAELLA